MLATIRKTDYSNTHVDQIVTNQAMAFFQNDDAFIAVKDVPAILVDAPSGILSVLDRDDLNRDEVAARSAQGQAEKAGFGFKDVIYKTDARSLEYDLNAAQQSGASAGRDPSKVIPMALAYKAKLHTEIRLAIDIFASSKWFRTVTGAGADGADAGDHSAQNRKKWSDPTADAIAALRYEIDIFIILTGMIPTNLRLGRQLFTAIANNPLTRAQVSVMVGGTSQTATFTPPATAAQLSQLLGLKVSVSSAVKNTANKGATAATNAFIVPAADGLLSYDAPTQYTDGQTPTGFARVVYQGLAPDGFQVRTFERPEIGPGGSMASVLDIYNGFIVVDKMMGTYLTGMI